MQNTGHDIENMSHSELGILCATGSLPKPGYDSEMQKCPWGFKEKWQKSHFSCFKER